MKKSLVEVDNTVTLPSSFDKVIEEKIIDLTDNQEFNLGQNEGLNRFAKIRELVLKLPGFKRVLENGEHQTSFIVNEVGYYNCTDFVAKKGQM